MDRAFSSECAAMMLRLLCVFIVATLVAGRHITEDQYIQFLQEHNYDPSEFGNYHQQRQHQNFHHQNEDDPFSDYGQTHDNLEDLHQQTAQFVDIDQYDQAHVPNNYNMNLEQQTQEEPFGFVKPARVQVEDEHQPKRDQQIEQLQDIDETQNKVEQFNQDQQYNDFQTTDEGFGASNELSGNIIQQTQDIQQEIHKIQLESENKQIEDLNQAQDKLVEVMQLGNIVEDLGQIEDKIENFVVDYDENIQQETQFEDLNQKNDDIDDLDQQFVQSHVTTLISLEPENQQFDKVNHVTGTFEGVVENESLKQETPMYVHAEYDQDENDLAQSSIVQTSEQINQEPQQLEYNEFIQSPDQQEVIEPTVEKIRDWNHHVKPKSDSQINYQQVNQKEDIQDLDQQDIERFEQKENYWNQQNNLQSPVVHNKENVLELVPEREEVEDLEQIQQKTDDNFSIEKLFGHEKILQNQQDNFVQQSQLEDEIDDEVLKQIAQQHKLNNQQNRVDQYKKLEGKESDYSDVFEVDPLTPHVYHHDNHEPKFVENPVEEKPTPKPQGYFGKMWSKAKDKAKAIVHKVREHVG